SDIAIADLAVLIAAVVGYRGSFSFDTSRPDGTPRKLLDVSKMASLGWAPKIGLPEGIWTTYQHWLASGGGPQPVAPSVVRDVA
ncbi:hypothetical protein KXR53_34575, partial [Inquilinus limosus]